MENYERSGREFIAYKGIEFSKQDIENALERYRNGRYVVKTKTTNPGNTDKVIFSKIVYCEYPEDRDPFMYQNKQVLTVNGYDHGELQNYMVNYNANTYGIDDQDRYQQLFNRVYCDKGTYVFKHLLDNYNMHFCTAIYDKEKDAFLAGITREKGDFVKLYVGFTKKNGETMYSNKEELLKQFCNEVKVVPENAYVKDGIIYDLNDNMIQQLKGTNEPQLIKNTRENANSIIDGLNALLVSVTNDAVKEKIENNVDEYLASDDPKKKIEDYITKELDTETQKQVLDIIKKAIVDRKIEEKVNTKLTETFDAKLDEYTKNIQLPVIHIVKLKDTVLGQTKGGFYHEKFDEVLSYVQLDEPVMLIGPAGSGKNHAIGQIAQALGLNMYYTNNASNEFKLTGFIDAGGTYRDTEFYKAFKNGGIFFLDEIDNSDPSALIVINSALANGYMAFPHETIDRHPNFRMVAAANTWGKGSDLQYVGRNALDGATLDRFDNVFFDYDKKLEQALYPNDEVLKFMWSFRDATYETKTPHIVSTRGIGKVYKKEVNGIPVENILRTNVIRNLGQDDLNTLVGSMKNINNGNKYYAAAKTLRLTR